MAISDRGLGSANMSEEDKHRIQSMGGQASHGSGNSSKSDVTTNSKGGGRLDKAAKSKGGRTSRGGNS